MNTTRKRKPVKETSVVIGTVRIVPRQRLRRFRALLTAVKLLQLRAR